MPFVKAEPRKHPLKMSAYGPQGSGKTLTALILAEMLGEWRGKRVAFVNSEKNGLDPYLFENAQRKCHPKRFDVDVLHTMSLAQALQDVRALSSETHGVIVVDSFSAFWQAAIDAYEGKMTSAGTIPVQAWGSIKKPYLAFLNFLISSPFDIIILGRQKNTFEEGPDGKLMNTGVAMRAEGSSQYEPTVCMRFEMIGERGQESTVSMFGEKDRYSVLAGRTTTNPTAETFKPWLQYLGSDVIPLEDEEERIAADGELLSGAEDKQAKKAEKSAALLGDLRAQLLSATTVEQLSEVADAIKKQKRYLLDDHAGALRVIYEERRKAIVATVLPEAIK